MPSSSPRTDEWWCDHVASAPPAPPVTAAEPASPATPAPAATPATRSAWPRIMAAVVAFAVALLTANAIVPDAGTSAPGPFDPFEAFEPEGDTTETGDGPAAEIRPPADVQPVAPDEPTNQPVAQDEPDDQPAGREERLPPSGTGPRPGTYRLELAGEISGRAFTRTAELVVTETIDEVATVNGVNALEVCLTSGFPPGQPEVGAIWFGTNSGCLPSTTAADIDMAYVEVDGSTIIARPDESVMALGVNTLTATDGLTALLYWIQDGAIELTFDGDDVSGTIGVRGFCGPCTFGPGSDGAWYEAQISGTRA